MNLLQEAVEAKGGLKKATREYLNRYLSNAFGFDFFQTAQETIENTIQMPARSVKAATVTNPGLAFGSSFVISAIDVLPPQSYL